MATIVPTKGCKDQDENPPAENSKSNLIFVETFNDEPFQSRYHFEPDWYGLLELLAPFSVDLVDNALDLRGHPSWGFHGEPSAYPAHRVEERRDH